MKDEEIARLRLRRQHLTGTPLPTPEAAVGWLGAVQAQAFGVAKWSIARRCRGRITSADLDRALAEGRIGLWRAVPHPEEALVELHLARPLDAATRSALEDELERYGHFLHLTARLLAKPRPTHGRRAQKRRQA